jgi:uncharacterized protein (DUF1501 family)
MLDIGMSAKNGKDPVGTAAIAHAAAAERMAATVVVAFEACEEAGVGLSEVQKIAFIETMLLQFDGFDRHVRTLEGVGQLLRRIGHS